MSLLEDQDAFYSERVPAQFNQTLEDQRKHVESGASAEEVARLEEMEAVRASIRVVVRSQDEEREHIFEIDRGVMQYLAPGTAPTRPPFMQITHSLADFANLRQECGDSLLGFLGGLAGLGDEMKLTALRVRNLRELAGHVRFERVGDGGFALDASFGRAAAGAFGRAAAGAFGRTAAGASGSAAAAKPEADQGVESGESQTPQATIRLSKEVYGLLRSGELDPQEAFLDGRVEIEGDLEMAVGLALTAASPD